MENLLIIYFCIIFITNIFKLKYGISLYIIYFLLIPIYNIPILSTYLTTSIINIIIIIETIIYLRIHKYPIRTKPLIPFLVFYIMFLVLMPFQTKTPLDYQFESWRSTALSSITLSFVIWNLAVYEKDAITLFRITTISCVTIALLYGIYLTKIPGENPYLLFVSIFDRNFDIAEWLKYFSAENTGRMFGRISSVYRHPMTFGLIIGLTSIYVYFLFLKKKINPFFFTILTILLSINLITCGVRSVIGGLLLSVTYYLYKRRNHKTLIYTLIIGSILYTTIKDNDYLYTYISSMASSKKKSEIQGSSYDMRINQLQSCFTEIDNCFLEGNGYNWSEYYKSNHGGLHPKLLGFESLIYVILCNSGIIGIAIWIYFIIYWRKSLLKIIRYNKYYSLSISLFIFYLSYSCITGEYGYMKYFIFFYTLYLTEIYNKPQLKPIHKSTV